MSTAIQLRPSFAPISVVGQKAKHLELIANGDRREAFNIIRKDEIPNRTYDFCDRVLNPLLAGADTTLVPILNGALSFSECIVSHVYEASHVELMSVTARSYGCSRQSGEVHVSQSAIRPEKVKDRTLVVIDDVLDTGRTMAEVISRLKEHGPKRIITVFMIRKMIQAEPLIIPDYWLFEVHGESWVFGYGMDLDEKYRHLRYVCDANVDLYHRDGSPRY